MRLGVLLAGVLVVSALLASVPVGASTSVLKVWETEAALGDAAVVFELEGPVPAPGCEVRVDLSGRVPKDGVVERVFVFPDGWLHDSAGQVVHVHAEGMVDTRASSSGYWASVTQFPLPHGEPSFTIAARGLQPWPSDIQDGWPDGSPQGKWSMRVAIHCTWDFDASIEGAREVLLLSMANAPGGVGSTSPISSVALQVEWSGAFTAPKVRMLAGTDGFEAGRLALEGPGYAQPWLLYPGSPTTLLAQGGAGVYRLELDRAGVLLEDFWALLMGLQPVGSLDDVQDLPGL